MKLIMDKLNLTIKITATAFNGISFNGIDAELFCGSLEKFEEYCGAFPVDSSVNDKLNKIEEFCKQRNFNLTLSWKKE